MIYYILVTDGLRVLMIHDTKLLLPNTSQHWPITKSRPKNAWSSNLLKHITYGLHEEAFEKPVRPFGFPVGQYLSICRLEPATIDEIMTKCTTIKRWAKYNAGKDDFGFRFQILTVKDANINTIDLMSSHGLRYVFPEITSATTVRGPSNIITNDP